MGAVAAAAGAGCAATASPSFREPSPPPVPPGRDAQPFSPPPGSTTALSEASKASCLVADRAPVFDQETSFKQHSEIHTNVDGLNFPGACPFQGKKNFVLGCILWNRTLLQNFQDWDWRKPSLTSPDGKANALQSCRDRELRSCSREAGDRSDVNITQTSTLRSRPDKCYLPLSHAHTYTHTHTHTHTHTSWRSNKAQKRKRNNLSSVRVLPLGLLQTPMTTHFVQRQTQPTNWGPLCWNTDWLSGNINLFCSGRTRRAAALTKVSLGTSAKTANLRTLRIWWQMWMQRYEI